MVLRSKRNNGNIRLAGTGGQAHGTSRKILERSRDAYPSLQKMYAADDGNTEVFYFKNATATFSSFTHEPEIVKF